ncbi:MAG: metallophosphoesterase [Candidatus Zixiibacteriota bacterium]
MHRVIQLFTKGTALSVLLCAPSFATTHFIVIGDRTGDHQPGIYEQAVAEIERLKPDFVLTVGDMIEGYTPDSMLLNQQWDEYFGVVKSLSMPIYYTPGNHDITYDAALPTYRSRVGEPYHSWDIGNMHFVSVDNSRWEKSEQLPVEQLDWLAADLQKNQNAKHMFVMFHKPFWYNSIATGKPDTLHNLFVKYGVDAVFCGHFHKYFSATYDGIMYTCIGSSGGAMDDDPTGIGYHFGWVTVDDAGIHVNPIKLGSVLPWEYTTTAELHTIDSVSQGGLVFEGSAPVSRDLRVENARVTLRVRNLKAGLTAADTLRWEIPEGWKVEPSWTPVTLNGIESQVVTALVTSPEKLYPLPKVTVNVPYKEGKPVSITRTLPIEREVICPLVSTPPVIDGQLDEPIWRDAIMGFFSPDGEPVKIESTYCFFACDRENLYLGARCIETKPDSIKAAVTMRDGGVTAEDCVGYFFQPDPQKDTVYQIYFSALGTMFDQKISRSPSGHYGGDRNWNGQYDVKTNRGDRSWWVEARIPLAQLGATATPGSRWRLNFLRKQQRLHSAANWQAPIYYDPSTYGVMVFQ